MTERTAMHEISHTLGIGQTAAFNTKCAANDWATATPLLRSWDGSSAKINCGGGHIWPYGLNVSSSLSLTALLFSSLLLLYSCTCGVPNAHPRTVVLSDAGLKLLLIYRRTHLAGPKS